MRKLGETQVIQIGNLKIGGDKPVIIGGPCAVESEAQYVETARAVKAAGGHILRGGLFKPRTNPYDFQGLGLEGLEFMLEAKKLTGLPIITELMDVKYLQTFVDHVDIIQIGSRNMYNYPLLRAVGETQKPVMLKRGISATIKEWVLAAEHIAKAGNTHIILCERGIRSFDDYTRNTLDLAAVPIMKSETGLPVIVDPSHGTGRRELIMPMSHAALAAGADGLMIETHIYPDQALSDKIQTIETKHFENILKSLKDAHLI